MSTNLPIPPRVCPSCQRENMPFAPVCACGQDLTSSASLLTPPTRGIPQGLGRTPVSSTQPGTGERSVLEEFLGPVLPPDPGLWPGPNPPAVPGFQFADETHPHANPRPGGRRRPKGLLAAVVIAIGAAVVLVPAAFIGGLGSAQAVPAASLSPSSLVGSSPAPGGSGSPTVTSPPVSAGTESPAPAASGPVSGSLSTARLDVGAWTITHTVTASTLDSVQIGDRKRNVYDATYACATPPCDLKISATDPETLTPAWTATFRYAAGTYSKEQPSQTERCILGDGQAVDSAYQVHITTTFHATAAKQQNGRSVATRLAGSQLREGEPTAIGVEQGCQSWRIELTTTGERGNSAKVRQVRNVNWSGYHVVRKGARFTNVEGTWVQPAVSCQSVHRQMASFWVGIDGVSSHNLQQVGTSSECLDQRQDLYYAWWEMLPAPMVRISMLIRPGDTIHASVSYSGSRFTLSITNETTDATFSIVRSNPAAKRATAEWVAEATSLCGRNACQVSALPDFDSVRFMNCSATAGGHAALLGDNFWTRSLDLMVQGTHRTTPKAQPSAIDAGSNGFTVDWLSVGP